MTFTGTGRWKGQGGATIKATLVDAKDLTATAFKAHPYRHPTIGWLHDLTTMTRDDLYGHYRRYYVPNNATLVVSGDFDSLETLYLIDKVNTIYAASVPADKPKIYSDGLFGELQGKTLWDAMSGIPIAGVDPQTVLNLKPHYEPVLRQHIEQTFWEGYHAGKQGQSLQPSNKKMIPTPRGSLESWMPLHHLTSLYQAGAEFANAGEEDLLRLQQTVDQITAMLYARTSLVLEVPYSKSLLVRPEAGLSQDAPAPETEVPALAAPQEPDMDLAPSMPDAEALQAKPAHA